jgi:anti-sigma regulatory factor (Ser/Thr protein kinase)
LRDVLASGEISGAVSPAAAIRRAVIDTATDDIAILTIGIGSNTERITRWVFRGDDAAAAMDVRRKLVQVLRSANASEVEVADAELVFGELLGNAVRHTNGEVEAALDLTGDEPILHVLDQGPGFRFHARLPNDDLSESGRGLFITKKLARDVSVTHRPGGGSHARVVLAARQRRFPLTGR